MSEGMERKITWRHAAGHQRLLVPVSHSISNRPSAMSVSSLPPPSGLLPPPVPSHSQPFRFISLSIPGSMAEFCSQWSCSSRCRRPSPTSFPVRLSIEVPPVGCQYCYKRVMKEFMKQAKVPGFRPGKEVPESILISHVGKQHVLKATVESILKRTLPHAMTSVTGKAHQDSIHIVTQFNEKEEIYSTSKSLRYEVAVDVAPEIKWNSEDAYKNLNVIVEIDSDISAQKASEHELKRRYNLLVTSKL